MSPIELQIVDLVVDAMGELTLNQLCAVGVRDRLAEAIATKADKLLDEAVDRKITKDLEGLDF